MSSNAKNIAKREAINRQLAAFFLSCTTGTKLDSVRTLAASLHASIGLISESIARLEALGAIEIERRGQLGSILTRQSIGRLWDAAVNQPLVIAQTLPSNRRYEGLATALKKTFNAVGIETYFIFIRGSRTRLQALRENRCHIAIVSQFAAEGLQTPSERIASTLLPGSFVKSHQVFYRKDLPPNQALTAAIDPDSYDQMQLSKIEFEGKKLKFKNISFMNIHHYLTENIVDLAIWTEEDMETRAGGQIASRMLAEGTIKEIGVRDTEAALVLRPDDNTTLALIRKVINEKEIEAIQNAVICGDLIPEY
jgi:hypothetical protein